jgi:GTP diphosphokinase / guanosine-3',5'-bis(diphosphate) 3'-diphosphatase
VSGKQKELVLYEDNYRLLMDKLMVETGYLDKKAQEQVRSAYKLAAQYHGFKRRRNGSFLISHGVEVCLTLARLRMDKESLLAALLHDLDIIEEEKTKKLIFEAYGYEVLFLIEQVKLLVQRLRLATYKDNEFSAEYLRQMFVATTQDLRAVILKLADRTHDLQSLEGFETREIDRIAKESLYIDAHIAARLGIYYFKNELENLSFSYTHPQVYKFMEDYAELNIDKRRGLADELVVKTEDCLSQTQVKVFKVKGRAKTYYSIFNKLKRKKGDLQQIYDLIALRVVVDSIPECYNALQMLHRFFRPLKGRFKDFIRYPKIDGYQSLHTTVQDMQTGLIFEFQIRTRRMDEFAEYGPVAHWRYKNQTEVELVDFLDPTVLKQIHEELNEPEPKAKDGRRTTSLKKRLSLFDDKVFAFNPDGEVCRLPKGSTVADYIKLCEPEVSGRICFVKVNSKICSLNYKINTGDVVEIIDSQTTELSRVKLHLRKN